MAGWDWQYDVDGVDPMLYCKSFRITTEYGLAGRDDTDFANPGQHGTLYAPFKLMGAGNVDLVTYILDSEPDGTVTHPDNRPGHIIENISMLKRLFYRSNGLVTISRTAPHIGAMELFVELIDQPRAGQDRHEIVWSLKSPKPMWRSVAATNTNPVTGNLNPGGDAPVDDAVVTFTGAGSIFNTTTQTGFEVTAACVVDCGAGRVTVGGSPAPGLILPRNERWLHFEGGINNALTVVGTPAMAHHAKWG